MQKREKVVRKLRGECKALPLYYLHADKPVYSIGGKEISSITPDVPCALKRAGKNETDSCSRNVWTICQGNVYLWNLQ